MLKESLLSLEQVRAALLQGDLGGLADSLKRQAHAAHAAGELRHARERFRTQIGLALGVSPQSVTLQWLAKQLPAEAGERIASCRERLCRLAAEVDGLNRSNAALILQSLDFLNQLLLDITGGSSGGNRYGATGRRQTSACGSLIEAQG